MRTQSEIAERFEEIKAGGGFGFGLGVLVDSMTFATASALDVVADDVDEQKWDEAESGTGGFNPNPTKGPALDDETIRQHLRVYIAFGWGKALDQRGLSASRTVLKLVEWAWLLGDDEAQAFAEDDDNYYPYGIPVLRYFSARFGVDVPEH